MGIQDCPEIQFGGFYDKMSEKFIHRMPMTNLNPEACKKYTILDAIFEKISSGTFFQDVELIFDRFRHF